jgi:hypothetical protein
MTAMITSIVPSFLRRYSRRLFTGTEGRKSVAFVVIESLAGVNSGPSHPSFTASIRISPGRFVDCRMT